MPGPDLLARALVAAALVVGLTSLPRVEREIDRESRRSDVAVVHGVPSIPGTPPGTAELVARVRREVPGDRPVRLVTPAGVCGGLPIREGQGVVFWLQYHLLPHSFTCENARWTLYFGVPPGPGRRTIAVPPAYALVEGAR